MKDLVDGQHIECKDLGELIATEEQVRSGLNGNICRCGTYANVIHAALMVVKGGANG